MAIVEHPHASKNSRETQWPELSRRIAKTSKRRNLAILWPELAGEKSSDLSDVLCWGLEAGGTLTTSAVLAAEIASGQANLNRLAKLFPQASLANQIESFLDRLAAGPLDIASLSEAVCWAYAMPRLALDFVAPAMEGVSENASSQHLPNDAAKGDTAKGKGSAAKTTRSSKKSKTLAPIESHEAVAPLEQDHLQRSKDKDFASTIDENLWWTLLGELQTISHGAVDQLASDSPQRLLAAGEIGAILAYQLCDLPSCDSIREESLDAICGWFDGEGDAVAAALSDSGKHIRTVLASAVRSRRLAARLKRRISLKRSGAAIDLATWIAATCRGDGSQMLGLLGAGKTDLRMGSLMSVASAELGGPALQTALDATLGKTKSEGRLAWQVELPEPAWFDEDAGLAVMLPEWDVRRGRFALSYKHPDRKMRFEISGGKHVMATGIWGARVYKDGVEIQPTTDWQDLCWHSDDDVHYLEMEQTFEGNVKLQRQVLMIRDDRCMMMADALIGNEGDDLKLVSSLPLSSNVHVEEERETRELLIVDGKVRALLLPLAMSEWKVGPTAGNVTIFDQQETLDGPANLTVEAEVKGTGAVYSPLWLDFDRKRVRQQKTWRQLTIGEKLRLVPPNEAAAFRVQTGEDQWIMYRSLNGQHNRTFLGKNIISEFFCGRFDAEDGTIEELVSVDELNE